MISALVLFIAAAPAATCSFNGREYSTVFENTQNDCCTNEVQKQYDALVSIFGEDFASSHARVKSNAACAGNDFVIDASDQGWVFEIEKKNSRFIVDPVEQQDECSYGLREDVIEHGYHPFESLLASEAVPAMSRCACGKEYGYIGTGKPIVKCNGDFVLQSPASTPQVLLDGGPVVGINLDPDSSNYLRIPIFIDLERAIFFCDNSPYSPAISGSFCSPVVEGRTCDTTRPDLRGCAATTPSGVMFLIVSSVFFVFRSLRSSRSKQRRG